MSVSVTELLGSLRDAHTLYLNALGDHIATLERVAAILDADIETDLAALREQRAIAELHCRALQAIYTEHVT